MSSSEKSEKLKFDIKTYVENHGWRGFFGLLATIEPEKMLPNDLEEIKQEKPQKSIGIEPLVDRSYTGQGFEHASIYAAQHIPAVLEDKGNTSVESTLEQPKTRVLENKSTTVVKELPEPQSAWQGLRRVSPGETDNQNQMLK